MARRVPGHRASRRTTRNKPDRSPVSMGHAQLELPHPAARTVPVPWRAASRRQPHLGPAAEDTVAGARATDRDPDRLRTLGSRAPHHRLHRFPHAADLRLPRLPGEVLPRPIPVAGRPRPGPPRRRDDARRRTDRPRSHPTPRPRRVRADDRHVPRGRHPGPADLAADPRPRATARPGPAPAAVTRRGCADHRFRVHHPRPAVSAGLAARGHSAELVGRVRRVGGRMLHRRRLESLIRFRQTAPGMPYAHPTVEHFAPLFVALGAGDDVEQRPDQVIDGFWMGLSKRSLVLV